MKEDKTLISGIEYKVRTLVKRLEGAEKEKQELVQERLNLLEEIRNQKEKLNIVEEKIKTLKLAKSLEEGPDKDQAKKKINELVREVDKCIGLLNT